MGQKDGRLLLIKRAATLGGADFATLGGMNSRNFKLSNERVDTTSPDEDDPSPAVQKTAVAGLQDRSFTGSGKWVDSAVKKAVADDARLGRAWTYQVIVPGYGDFVGLFVVTDFEWSGEMQGTMDYSGTWDPSGALAFTAGA